MESPDDIDNEDDIPFQELIWLFFLQFFNMTPDPKKPISSEGLKPYSGPKKPYVPVNLNFAGVQGNDRFSIHTPEGVKWMKIGQEANGYLISGYNPKTKELQVTQKGRHFIVPMNAGNPTEYVPPSSSLEHPYTTDPTLMMTDEEQDDEWKSQFKNIEDFQFNQEEFDAIWNNSQKSTYMTDEQKRNIFTLDAYHKNLKKGELKPDTDYLVPRKLKDGTIDFDIFKYTPQDIRGTGPVSPYEQESINNAQKPPAPVTEQSGTPDYQ